ncbi:unnamed protein product [Cuscuta europaea]|uniref:Uncharacterized protein n=1 Tax=Cuscuta europaea TaxID=41803 RepID=A0A9P0YMT6_CUSEU|nr:unnamed protein product [Cuscuta europaea]
MAGSSTTGMWSMIKDIDHTKSTWALKVRVVRAYEVPPHSKGGETLEMVLHDAEGDRIHAIIKRPQIAMYKTIITEHKIYAIRNFLVLDNYQTVKTTNHPYLIQFISKTQFREDTKTELPMMVYDFHPFDMLHAQRVINDKTLIDIIGKVINKSIVQTHIINGKTERLMELTVADPEGNRLDCVLWNKYINQYQDYVNENPGIAVFVIFQLCRPKRYQGTLSVASSFDVSKLIINGNTTEFLEFQSEFPADGDDSISQTCNTNCSQGEGSRDVLSGHDVITTMEDLMNANEEEIYWVLGEIVSIKNTREWCYLRCPTCHKKLVPEERFRCSTCSVTLGEGVYRYKVSVCIMDNTGHGNFILWDRECIEILGKTSASLMAEVQKKTCDPTRFPEDIESLIDKNGIFKIQLKKRGEENAYKCSVSLGVVSMIRDPNVLAMYEGNHEQLVSNESHECTPEKIGSCSNLEGNDNSIREKSSVTKGKGKRISAEKEVTAPIELSDSPVASTQREVIVELDDKIKRNLNDEFSGNGNGKKLKIKIKQEKL